MSVCVVISWTGINAFSISFTAPAVDLSRVNMREHAWVTEQDVYAISPEYLSKPNLLVPSDGQQ